MIFSSDDQEEGEYEEVYNEETGETERHFWFHIPYPGDGDGKILQPGNLYDYDEWTGFLELHDFNINTVFRIEFLEDGRLTIYSYRHDSEGRPFLRDDNEIATMEPVTLKPKVPIPAWS